jgi:hypothetical protein
MTHCYPLAARAASFRRLALAAAALLLALLLPGYAQATVYYVDAARADNTGDGLNWTTAKKDVQNALNLASAAGDEVWVKAGTYLPTQVPPTTTGTTPRDQTFYLLTTDIKLYGGFAGTETAAFQRNPAANLTTLSGDLDGPTVPLDAYHVLLCMGRSSACVVDGFTIRAGRANGGGTISVNGANIARNSGGGLCNSGSSPTVSNCTFSANAATTGGGGMYNVSSSRPTVSSCTFSTNSAAANGGGMYNAISSSPAVSSCTFSGNTASTGGGMYNNGSASSPTVSSCTFSANTATTGGGGMYNTSSSPTVSNCIFSANAAGISGVNAGGGGMYNTSNSSPTVSSCTFSANTVTINNGVGGGMYNSLSSNPTVSSCTFSANTAPFAGGLSNSSSNPTVRNCTFSGNIATGAGGVGGGMYNFAASSPAVSNCTFSGNTATGASGVGGGLDYASNAGGSLTNCILYQNTTPNNAANPNREEIYKVDTATPLTVSYCIVRDAAGPPSALTVANVTLANCYTDAPGYVDAADPDGPDDTWATADDGLRLACGSFAVDKGTGSTPATDILGNPRKGTLDLGAYEATGGTAPANAIPAATTTVSEVQTAAALPYTDCQNQLLLLNATSPYTLLGSTVATVRVLATAPAFLGQPYVRRTYDIAPATNAATATAEVTLYFTQADFDDYNAARGSRPALPLSAADPEGYIANLRITQKHGRSATGAVGSYTGWAGAGPATVFITPTAVAYNATAARWEVRFPVTGFSGFFAHTGPSPLPVELTAFTATLAGQAAVSLAWATASEKNSQQFEVERSLDGRTFAPLGTVAAAGRSSAPRSYELLDARLPGSAALLYYRLRQVDLDGTFSYSPVRTVSFTQPLSRSVTLFPNPSHGGAATLTGAQPGTAVTVLDALGRPVTSALADASGTAALTLPAGMPTGVYVVRAGTRAVRLTVE